MKRAVIFLCILVLLFISGCRTKAYPSEKAIKNGEIVFDFDGTYNVDKLDKFIENVNNRIPDKVKITQYGDEGMFLIETISYDGKVIKAVFDSTMEFHESSRKKEVKEYSEIEKVRYFSSKVKGTVFFYYLRNENERIEIFISPESHSWRTPK